MLSWIHDDYHLSIWKSIADKIARYNVNLPLFAGGTPYLPNLAREAGLSIYDLVKRIFDPEQISQLTRNLVTAIPTPFIRAIITGLNQAVENTDPSAIGDAVWQLEILSNRQEEKPLDY